MRLLVVEDEPKLAYSLKEALELQGYAVDVALDGQDGLDLASSNPYDLLIVDWMLPKLDGLTLCKILRSGNIKTPIIMLTAKGQVKDRVDGLDTGADDYLVKPFDLSELFSRIRALLRRSHKQASEQLVYKDMVLDQQQRQVKVSSQIIMLSAKEFAILEYLLLNLGKVVSKQSLVDHVWNYDADILPNTVEVHVKNIREKLKANSSGEIIQTIRGFGYKIG